METFLEILKYTIPGMVVFATAYYLLKLYLDDRLRYEMSKQRGESMKITLPLRLQAYERLTLLCDRVSVPNTLLRIRMPGMTVGDLRGGLMLAISQEFDHNTSQQLYVSDTLWQIRYVEAYRSEYFRFLIFFYEFKHLVIWPAFNLRPVAGKTHAHFYSLCFGISISCMYA